MTARGGDTWVVLRRSCPAATVPDGQPVELSEGGRVQVVQQRGGSITLRTEMGTLLRIDAEHADAVGLEAPERRVVVGPDQPFHLDLVTEALGTVYDPEPWPELQGMTLHPSPAPAGKPAARGLRRWRYPLCESM